MNRYSDIPITTNSEGKRMYIGVKYPNIPLSETDAYILCNSTDRYDKLALSYYGDKSLWWIISIANNASTQNSLFPPLDTYVRIPGNYLDIVGEFNNMNDISLIPLNGEENSSNNINGTTPTGGGNITSTGGGNVASMGGNSY